MPQVRLAEVADVPRLLPMVQAYWAFEEISGFDRSRVSAQLTRLLSEPRLGCGWIAFAEEGGAPAGYLLAVYIFSLEYLGLTVEIDEFFVTPRYRGSGLGVELLEAAEAGFVSTGCTKVSLQLSRQNDSARRFYRRRGYEERSGYELMDKALHKS